MNRIGVIIVDHGSRAAESNKQLEEITKRFAQRYGGQSLIVEPAHMELSEPNIDQAYVRCVRKGAHLILICPYFLGPGSHWQHDLPRLAAEAARQFPDTSWRLTAPLGMDDHILELLAKRVVESVALNIEPDEELASHVHATD